MCVFVWPQVETQRDRSLRRRIQSLQCFLFEQLHRELTQPTPTPNPTQNPPAAPSSPTTNEGPQASPPGPSQGQEAEDGNTAAERQDVTSSSAQTQAARSGEVQSAAQAEHARQHSGRAEEVESALDVQGAQAQQGSGEPASRSSSVIDATFGLVVRQRTKVLTVGSLQADRFRESRSFQVPRQGT